MDLKKRTRREGGFTLIELISVIIILGILAAVVVPKYFDMTGRAQDAAYRGALSEGAARFNMAYAQYILVNSRQPNALNLLTTPALLGGTTVNIGDYDIAFSGGGTGNQVTLALSLSGNATILDFNNGSDATTSIPWP